MRFSPLLCLLAAVILFGCGDHKPSPISAPITSRSSFADSSPIKFASVASESGIHFNLTTGGKSPLNILDTSGGGCAFIDYDGDGWPDIVLAGPHKLALYHNEHNGKFRDVTSSSGLDTSGTKLWMGCTVGDFDGDGKPDIFLTGYHCFALYQNLSNGHFKDVTAESGISGLDWSLSAAFADITNNGMLDLYVSQYVDFNLKSRQNCMVGAINSACGPEVYKALSGKLFRNQDGHHFKSVPWSDTGKTWGVLASDIMNTGRPQIYLANDMMPGDLWSLSGKSNLRKNLGPESGTAYDGRGNLQGGMAVDSGDYDNDGKLDLLVTTYAQQPLALYHNDGSGLFTFASSTTGLAPPSIPYVKFGAGFVDLDNDGWLDILTTSGHVRDNIHQIDSSQSYAQPIQIYHNHKGQFEDVSANSGLEALKIVGRGISFADYDHDGKMDAVIINLEGNAVLLHNITPSINHWLEIRLSQTGSNRAGIGARVTLTSSEGTRIGEVRTSGGILSAKEPTLHFGLGKSTGPIFLTVRWPDGNIQKETASMVDRIMNIRRLPH